MIVSLAVIGAAILTLLTFAVLTGRFIRAGHGPDLHAAIADALQCRDCFFQITEPGRSIYIPCPRHDLGPVKQ